MKKSISILMVLLIALTTIPTETFADAKAKRKNRCKRGKHYYVKAVVNGKNCRKKKFKDWKCYGLENYQVNFVDNDCKCSWYYGPNLSTAATAWAKSTSNYIGSIAQRFTACKRFKAGSEKELLQDQDGASDEYHQPIFNQAKIWAKSELYDYENNTLTLDSFSGNLKIDAIDFLNEYAIINFEIVKIIIDPQGSEIEEIISYAQAKLINGQLVVTGNTTVFSADDFVYSNVGDILNAEFSFHTKAIPLNFDIHDSMELEIRLSSDVGNIEDGPSEIDIDPITLNASYNFGTNNIDIVITSDDNRDGTILIRDAFGNDISSLSNIELLATEPKTIQIPTGLFLNTSFYVVIFTASDGIKVVDKFILLD